MGLRLSKSKFTAGLQCHKLLWWKTHERDAPELVPDAAQQAIFDTGTKVGEAAQVFYGGGTLVEIDFKVRGGIDRALERTRELIEAGETIIYEACFRAHDVFVAIDILRRVDGVWVLGEVKSTLSLKPQHVNDAAVQAWVARACGIEVERIEVVTLNRKHRHPDVEPLFIEHDVTEAAEAFIPTIEAEVKAQLTMLRGKLPVVQTGPHCTSPYECAFRARCWEEVPPNHVSQLHRVGKQVTELEAAGYETIESIPDNYPLSPINRRLRRSVLEGGVVVEPGLNEALGRIEGKVAYLDFETVMPALPVWDGCAPYQQMTVQFSVHRRTVSGVEHEAYLARGKGDPRAELAKALVEATRGYDTVLAYYAQFEASRIRELAAAVPEYREELLELVGRLFDLLPLVREHVGHPEFGGSFSLKKVAPALVGNSYADLEVADGGTAAMMLGKLLLEPESLELDVEKLRADLLAYCERDTEVLVELHDELVRLAGDEPREPNEP